MAELCKRCGIHSFTPYGQEMQEGDPFPPALSRLSRGENDVPIWVCSECGQDEAMMEYFGSTLPTPDQWPVGHG